MTSSAEAYIHPTAVVDLPCQIGLGTQLWHFSHVMKDSRIGDNCILGQNVMVGSKCAIGDRVKIQNNVSIYTGVTIEDDVFCGPSAVFTNVLNPRAFIERKEEFRSTLVERGATVGANATILCGVRLGRYCMVGAGAVVTRDVPRYAIVYGNPACPNGWVCQCGIALPIEPGGPATSATCDACGCSYELDERGAITATRDLDQ